MRITVYNCRVGAFAFGLLILLAACGATFAGESGAGSASPCFGNGIKIGEVTSTSAIIWVRLTEQPEMVGDGGVAFRPLNRIPKVESDDEYGPTHNYLGQVPKEKTLNDITGAIPGMPGKARLTYWQGDNPPTELPWQELNKSTDCAGQFELTSLEPATKYHFRVEATNSDGKANARLEGEVRTAPAEGDSVPVTFTVVTGTKWLTLDDKRGQKIYPAMQAMKPDFFVHTGDLVYYDNPKPQAVHVDLARFKWGRMFALPFVRDFYSNVPSYIMKDDHEAWTNDCWPTMKKDSGRPPMGGLTYEQSRATWYEQTAMSEKPYRTFRWGRDLQVWLVEVREFRDPNHAPDSPDKSMWGEEQVAWFKRTVEASDATFRVLISPTPVVGPDHDWKERKADNHVNNKWKHEGDWLRNYLAEKEMYLICGDRHWQYVSKHPELDLREYSCGPSTDRHATAIKGLSDADREMLKYYRPKGGYLSVTVERTKDTPAISLRHHDVDGEVQNEDRFTQTKR